LPLAPQNNSNRQATITPEAAREYLDRLKQVKTRMIEAQALPAWAAVSFKQVWDERSW